MVKVTFGCRRQVQESMSSNTADLDRVKKQLRLVHATFYLTNP